MAKLLNDQQRAFLDAMLGEARGDPAVAKKIAGYADSYNTGRLMESLKDELIEATKTYLAYNAPKAAMALIDAIDDPSELGLKDKITSAKDVLDRIGLVKQDRVLIESDQGIALMPQKIKNKEEEELDDEGEERNH